MKKLLLILVLLTVFLSKPTLAQVVKGNGLVKDKTQNLNSFSQLVVQGNFSLYLVQGEKEGLTITCDENIHNFFQISQEDDQVYLSMTADIRKSTKLEVRVSFKHLESLTLLNNINFKTEHVLHFDDLIFFVSGVSRVDCELYASSLKLQVVDGAYANLRGYSENFNVFTHDETEVNAFAMQSDYCSVQATGLSETMVDVQKSLALMVTGASNVYYSGNPTIESRTFSSSGFIIKRKNTNRPR